MRPSVDLEAQQCMEPLLEPGESLHWAGRPRQGLRLRREDVFLIPFSLMWGGFAIFWEVGVLTVGGPTFFALWGVPFVLVGLYMIVGRFFVDARLRANTFYGLTDRRVIVHKGLGARSTTSLMLKNLDSIELTERSDGSGSILLGRPNPANRMGGMQWPGMVGVPCLEMIEDAREVHALLREAQQET